MRVCSFSNHTLKNAIINLKLFLILGVIISETSLLVFYFIIAIPNTDITQMKIFICWSFSFVLLNLIIFIRVSVGDVLSLREGTPLSSDNLFLGIHYYYLSVCLISDIPTIIFCIFWKGFPLLYLNNVLFAFVFYLLLIFIREFKYIEREDVLISEGNIKLKSSYGYL